MLPEFLKDAPAWVTTLFWVLVACGTAFFFLRSVASGIKVESKTIAETGRPTPASVIGGELPGLGAQSLAAIGNTLIDRQMTEDKLHTLKVLTKEIGEFKEAIIDLADEVKTSGLAAAVVRLAVVHEKQASLDEREAHQAAITEEARRLARVMVEDERRAAGLKPMSGTTPPA